MVHWFPMQPMNRLIEGRIRIQYTCLIDRAIAEIWRHLSEKAGSSFDRCPMQVTDESKRDHGFFWVCCTKPGRHVFSAKIFTASPFTCPTKDSSNLKKIKVPPIHGSTLGNLPHKIAILLYVDSEFASGSLFIISKLLFFFVKNAKTEGKNAQFQKVVV